MINENDLKQYLTFRLKEVNNVLNGKIRPSSEDFIDIGRTMAFKEIIEYINSKGF
jgi:hypothetical protein